MPKCRFILKSMRIVKIRTPRLARFALYNSPAWLMWRGDYATYHVEVVITVAEWTWLSWIYLYCCYAEGRWFDSLLGWLGAMQHYGCNTKSWCSDRADVAVIPRNTRTAPCGSGKRYTFFQNLKTGVCNPWSKSDQGSSFVAAERDRFSRNYCGFWKVMPRTD